ncbi:MAG: sulfatase-like hydrolase/transferase, partial [Planctomycetota bacterium]
MAIAILCALLLWACPAPEEPAEPLNFVLISLDNLAADHMSCYGYGRNTTPFIDALAEDGVLFDNVTAQDTWTLPSHASLLTSRFVAAHGVERSTS